MARSRSSVFEDLIDFPWHISAVLALLCYPVALILEGSLESKPLLQGVGTAATAAWPYFSLLFAMSAMFSLIRQLRSKRLFKQNQTSSKIRALTWQQFERFIGEIYREQGYTVTETPEGPDGGVDLILWKDDEKTFVQCKHWKAWNVGVSKVRELLGSMTSGGAHNGIFVTTGSFTEAAGNFARQHGIELVDGSRLGAIFDQLPIQETERELTESADHMVLCPRCGATMVESVAKRGGNCGKEFWGCSEYPKCRGIVGG